MSPTEDAERMRALIAKIEAAREAAVPQPISLRAAAKAAGGMNEKNWRRIVNGGGTKPQTVWRMAYAISTDLGNEVADALGLRRRNDSALEEMMSAARADPAIKAALHERYEEFLRERSGD